MPTARLHENVLIPQHFGSLLYVRKRHEYLPYDHLTTHALTAAAAGSIHRLPPGLDAQITGEQKRAFMKAGRSLGFLDRSGRFMGRVITAPELPEGRLAGPLTLHLSVTQDCDLACRHCFASNEMGSADRAVLDDATLDALFDDAAAMGCMRIALTGGEPLNRPDVFALMDRITARGIDVCVTTNGLRIDKHTAREFRARPFAWVNVSLEGATAATNDAVRGTGVFDRVVGNLKRHFKWRVRFALSVTLNRLNVHELHLLPGLARSVGAESVMMRGVYPIGRAASDDSLCLSFAEYQEAIEAMRQINGRRRVFVVPTSCEPGDLEDVAVVFENFGCAAGNTVATVCHNGDVSPCSLIEGGMRLDSLRRTPFGQIWHEGEAFRAIRGLDAPGVCGACDALASCSGGCRARAWAAHRDLGAPDPWCKHAASL